MDYTLTWEPGYEDKVRDKEVIEKEVRSVLDECVARIPKPAMKVILEPCGEFPSVTLFADKNREAGLCLEEICLNVHDRSRHQLIWTAAHELAHCYWYQLLYWAAGYLMRVASEIPSRKKRNQEVIDCLEFGGNAYDPFFVERRTDSLAISWGFEREYAESVDLAALRDRTQTRSDYFDSQLATIVEILQRRMATLT